jgi:hypothetical protein
VAFPVAQRHHLDQYGQEPPSGSVDLGVFAGSRPGYIENLDLISADPCPDRVNGSEHKGAIERNKMALRLIIGAGDKIFERCNPCLQARQASNFQPLPTA